MKALRQPIYRVARAFVIEAQHVLFIDVVGCARNDPLRVAGIDCHDASGMPELD
jgi:hypothetical protein